MPPLIQFSSDRKDRSADKHLIEDSIALRTITTLMALLGIIIAASLTESPLWLLTFSVLGCTIGSWYSYKMRYKNNLLGKIWISLGILIVAGLFFNELLVRIYANVADARTPLTQMLMALMALHSFDLPRRRDLSLSALVGFILITAASTLSRDFSFLIYFSVFFVLSAIMFQLDCSSRTVSRAFMNMARKSKVPESASEQNTNSQAKVFQKNKPVTIHGLETRIIGNEKLSFSKSASTMLLIGLAMILCTLFCFSIMPRYQVSLLKQIRFGSGMNMPFLGQISSPANLPQLMSPDGSIRRQPNSYYGFAESLDTNYRGKLSDRVVLRVQGGNGNYLRGMAYDTFDGKDWTMSLPKKTTDCFAAANHSFQIPLKNSIFQNVHFRELLQVIYVEEDSSNLVVYTNFPHQVYFPAGKLQVDTYGAIRSPVGVQKDMVYTVSSNVPVYNYERLRDLAPPRGERHERWQKRLTAYLQIPNIDPKVVELARTTAGEGGDFAKAERLCKFLISHYKYDLDVGTTESGQDSVSDFLLHKKRGYCEHFASALAIMCRTQNIPTRLVTGYAPGEYNPFTGFWDVRLCDAHSWTEVFIEGAGWIPMDATPNGMGVGNQTQEQASVFSYFESRLFDALKNFSESRDGKHLTAAVDSFIGSAAKLAVSLSSNLFNLLIGAALLALAMSAVVLNSRGARYLFHKLLGKLSPSKSAVSSELRVHAAASAEYLKVLSLLEEFGVLKLPGDTASDIMQKLYLCPRSAELEEITFLETCRAFFRSYSLARFGAAGELSELKHLSRQLHDLAEKLSNQRSSASIS